METATESPCVVERETKLVGQSFGNTLVLNMLNENCEVQITLWKFSQDISHAAFRLPLVLRVR